VNGADAASWQHPSCSLVVFAGRLLDARLVVVGGEVDLANAEQLRVALLAATRRSGVAETIRVDLAHVRFLDARGVSALVEASLAARRAGVRFVVQNPHGVVRRVLEATGTAPLLGVAPPSARLRKVRHVAPRGAGVVHRA
jgi:anti-sigma B factor antagonist